MNTTIPSVADLKAIGYLRNNWRRRMVTVYQHPTEPDMVIASGAPFDGGNPIVCVETKASYRREINMFPKVAIYD